MPPLEDMPMQIAEAPERPRIMALKWTRHFVGMFVAAILAGQANAQESIWRISKAVSYTHLTLPTN